MGARAVRRAGAWRPCVILAGLAGVAAFVGTVAAATAADPPAAAGTAAIPQAGTAVAPPPTPDGLLLTGVNGPVVSLRAGRSSAMHVGALLHPGDDLVVGTRAQATAGIAGRGELAAGSGARFAVEALPGPAKPHGPTVFTLLGGGVHILWRGTTDPTVGDPRLLYVYTGTERLALQPGEYFLRHTADTAVVDLCVAAGGVTWQAIGSTRGGAVTEGKCMTTRPSGLSESAFTAGLRQSLSEGWALPALEPVSSGPALAAAAPARLVATAGATDVRGAKPSASGNRPPAAEIAATRERSRSAELHRELTAAAEAARRPDAGTARGAEAASVPAEASVGSSSGWAINVASSPEPEDARRQRQRLADAGYDAVVVPAQVDGQTWYRVQLTGFGSRDEALAQVASLESRFAQGRQLWVVRSR